MPVSTEDPLDVLLRPPANESPEGRLRRLEKEAEAKRISQAIDASIKAEKIARRRKRIVRLLLLGQSESGKSTTLRQFQRLYTPTAFREERILWRAVIQLNIVRSIRTILDATVQATASGSPYSSPKLRARSVSLTRPQHQQPVASGSSSSPRQPHFPDVTGGPSTSGQNINDNFSLGSPPPYPPPLPPQRRNFDHHHHSQLEFDDLDSDHHATGSTCSPFQQQRTSRWNRHPIPNANGVTDSPQSYNHHHHHHHRPSPSSVSQSPLEILRARLAPLRRVEALLISRLVQPDENEIAAQFVPGVPMQDALDCGEEHQEHSPPTAFTHHYPPVRTNNHSHNHHNNNAAFAIAAGAGAAATFHHQEISVRFGPGWKGIFARARVDSASPVGTGAGDDASSLVSHRNSIAKEMRDVDEAQQVLYSCRRDMLQLWHDPDVKEILRRRKIRLEESSGFFLDDLERVTSLKYLPSDDDVLKARLKTVGVSEYRFEMEIRAGRDSVSEWRIIDVGGSRSQRPTWVSFFDDVDAIIFLAPISGFDQALLEDRTINRLEDSVLLWKAVCSSKLLANVDLILFLNKCDILDKKLKSGIQLSKYVRNYTDKPNDLENVCRYLRGKFSAIQREYSRTPRKFYAFCTSVTDLSTTAGIIASVRDMVIRQYLKSSKLL